MSHSSRIPISAAPLGCLTCCCFTPYLAALLRSDVALPLPHLGDLSPTHAALLVLSTLKNKVVTSKQILFKRILKSKNLGEILSDLSARIFLWHSRHLTNKMHGTQIAIFVAYFLGPNWQNKQLNGRKYTFYFYYYSFWSV